MGKGDERGKMRQRKIERRGWMMIEEKIKEEIKGRRT